LAPGSKYPNIVDENLEAYERIASNCEKMFYFKIRKLAIVGDSGGGFMVLNVIKHSIRKNLRVPDAACLIYPCSRIIYDWMSPSLMMGTRDNFIDPGLMTNIQSLFLDLDNKSISDFVNDDRLNFYLTDQDTLSKFPKTLIVSGTNDPIRDECYLLADILL
jgi:acetyl esterase/lipase